MDEKNFQHPKHFHKPSQNFHKLQSKFKDIQRLENDSPFIKDLQRLSKTVRTVCEKLSIVQYFSCNILKILTTQNLEILESYGKKVMTFRDAMHYNKRENLKLNRIIMYELRPYAHLPPIKATLPRA